MVLTGAEIFARVLMEQGVDTIFGYPGAAVLDLYEALYNHADSIRHILTAHEQGAAHAADGYARATGRTGVVLATSGPGATNLVTGIAAAFMDSVPMVAITGNVATDLIGKDSFQEVYITGITMPITKHNYVVQHTSELAPILREAFAIAGSGRKGPVLVDIPKNVAEGTAEYEPEEALPRFLKREAEQDQILLAAEKINQASKPMLYIGGGAVASEAADLVRALSQKGQIPGGWTIMATGVLPYEAPENLGMVGMHGRRTANLAIANADCLIAIGTRFSDRVATDTNTFAKRAFRIQIDVDPSEVNKNVSVDLSLVGDAKEILSRLLPLIEEKEHPDWMRQIRRWQMSDYVPSEQPSGLSPHRVMELVSDLAGPEALFTTDVGQHQMWAAQYLKHRSPRHFLTSGGLGAMGYGYGAAIGAKVACPDKKVIHITSDGSFHMNLNEAVTAVSYGLPVITIILNNQALGMVRQWQKIFYDKHYSATEPDRHTDYVKVAEGFGLKGFHCETLPELEEALKSALQETGPVWIECAIDKEEMVLPMIPGGGTLNQMIIK